MVVVGSPTNVADFASALLKGSKQYFTKRTLPPGGSGVFGPAWYLVHPTLPNHTIYTPHPSVLRAGAGAGPHPHPHQHQQRLPVLIWANGMSLAWGLMFSTFLREIASHGYIVIANGPPGENSGVAARLGRLHHMEPSAMVDAVRWVQEAAAATAATAGAAEGGDGDGDGDGVGDGASCCDWPPDDVRAYVDASRIALAGQSRGGLDAYAAAAALRGEACIRTVGMFNSAVAFRNAATAAQVRGIHVPVFYFVGGKADIAHKCAEQDWELLPEGLPAWCGNLDVGHWGTFYEGEAGGEFARAALDWLGAMLNENEEARRRMVEEYAHEGWQVKSRNMRL
ncbi:unnamed protein product [Discula destructiva]